jgi:hypothetical protein
MSPATSGAENEVPDHLAIPSKTCVAGCFGGR